MKKEYFSINEAAKIIGVSALTLRNWDKSGKFRAGRHPVNNYRIYKKEKVEELLKQVATGSVYRLKISKPKKIQIRFLSDKS